MKGTERDRSGGGGGEQKNNKTIVQSRGSWEPTQRSVLPALVGADKLAPGSDCCGDCPAAQKALRQASSPSSPFNIRVPVPYQKQNLGICPLPLGVGGDDSVLQF